MRASRGLKWENKMYKLKRSIGIHGQERVKTDHSSVNSLWAQGFATVARPIIISCCSYLPLLSNNKIERDN